MGMRLASPIWATALPELWVRGFQLLPLENIWLDKARVMSIRQMLFQEPPANNQGSGPWN